MGLTELQTRKIDLLFDQIDENRNGELEIQDVQGFGTRILKSFGEGLGSEKAQTLFKTFMGIWETICAEMDTNKDGKISRAEFRSGMDSAFVDGGKYDVIFRPATQAVLDLCNANDKGEMPFGEFLKLQNGFGTTPADSKAAFVALDRDHNGSLSVDELVVAAKQFYTSDDPNAVGNALFGPLKSA